MESLSQPEAIDPTILKSPIVASVQPPTVADRPRSTRYDGKCTVMNAS